MQKLRIVSDEEDSRTDEILKQRVKIEEETRQMVMGTKGEAMLSGNIFCAHCGGRITTTHHKDYYFRKDGSENI